ncbi:MAG TPA: helix-turn-helix domain-containing protein [Candidatus Paceibacterota bacterium]
MIIDEANYLAHYGILRKSGRYPWGSGGDVETRSRDFLGTVNSLKAQGLSEAEIMRGFGMNTTDFRVAKSIARNAVKQADIGQAQRLKDKGYSNVEIGKRMNIPESSVRSLLAPGQADKAKVLEATSNMLKDQIDKKTYLDVGAGAELHAGVSREKLNVAIARLKEEGYKLHYVKVEQLGTGQQTTMKVLTKPDVPYSEVFRNRDKIQQVAEYSTDGGRTYTPIRPPVSISSKRVAVRYADQGGAEADGVIYVRRGVDELSLGRSNYAQVRIAVDGTHYLKGMAMYKDDMPAGVDLVFNTNKHNTGNKLDAMKELKRLPDGSVDHENPFGANVSRQHGVMNIVNEEGNWGKWSNSLSSQFLSKQSPALARTQLDMTYERRKSEFEEINALTNPTVRKKLLEAFAEDVDSSAVHLQAAALPRQGGHHVILPIDTIKENEIYAPNFNNGEKVVLVRHPHGGIFEIPELTVNNKNPEARRSLGTAPKDAVGIHHKVAARLSGADFDGDTVLVIPNNQRRVKTKPALEGLKGFDPMVYKLPDDSPIPRMHSRTKQVQMGVVSNLITDMTIRGATDAELARAVRHSMVVIDAEKHGLNWKQSAIDNGIAQLKEKYQGGARAGASTLISRATSEKRVPERKQGFRVDKATGEKIFTPTGATITRTVQNKRTGLVKEVVVPKTIKSTKLAETRDANTLSSGTPMEKVYAEHSNKLKALANEARKAGVNTRGTPYSPSAKTAYAKEVASLNSKLNIALRNAPLERQAQVIANAEVSLKRASNPNMEASDLKKVRSQALAKARARTGAHKQRIEFTDAEWAAVQAGAVSSSKLDRILANADLDQVKKLATPKTPKLMTSAKQARAQAMFSLGYTQAEVASALGVSLTTLKTSLGE